MKKILVFFLLSLGTLPFRAQEVLPITWEEVEKNGLQKNLQVQKAKDETAIAQAELLQSRALFLPDLKLSYTFMNTNNPMMAFGTKLNQQRIGQEDFNPQFLNNPGSISDFATQIEVQQPLLNIDGLYEKKAGQTKVRALHLKAERTEEYVQFEVHKAYMMLQLTYKVKETLQKAQKTTLANKKVVDDYYKNGMVQKPEVLDLEVRLKEIENQLQEAESNIANASDYLFFLLNMEGNGRRLKPKDSLVYRGLVSKESPLLDETRKDIQAHQKSAEVYDYMVKSSNSAYLPRLNAFGSYELHDHEIATFRNNGYSVGLQLSWTLFDGLKANSQKRKYRAEKEKAQTEIQEYIQKSQLELKKAHRHLRDADNKVQLAQKAYEQSKEAYRIRQNRYREGLEKSSDLLLAETTLSQKNLEYQQAIFEYNTALAYYEFLN